MLLLMNWIRDKASKLAQMNETESGDSQTEQSDKSKKAKKQRRLERKERSLLKQKKRLSIKLSEQAKKVCRICEKLLKFFPN